MIRRIGITLVFPGSEDPVDVSHLYRDGSAHVSERLFNDDKRSVQDSFSFSLVYDAAIVDAVRQASGRIAIRVRDLETSAPLFSGVIEPNASQSSAQVAEPLRLEAVDATWRLDSKVASSFEFPVGIGSEPFKVCDPADPAHSIFHQVCFMAGYEAEDVVPDLASTATVLHCAATAGQESYRDFLDALLFEHGLVLDDDGQGRLTLRKWTRTAAGFDETIDEDDLSVVEPFVWARRYIQEDGIRLEWAETQVMDDALLYRDSLPVSADGVFTGKPVASGDYYPPDSDIEELFQEYVDRWLDRPYLERTTRLENTDISLVTTDQHEVVFQADSGLAKDLEEFEPHRARIRFVNASAETRSIYSFEIRGRALYRSAVRTVLSPSGAANPRVYTSRFLFNAVSAADLANALALDLAYGDFEYTFGLNRYVQPGTILRLVNLKSGIDTQAIVQECDYDIGRPVYRYRAVGLAEYALLAATSSGRTGAALWPLIQAIEAQIVADVAAPPSNNVTDVVFASSQNADGTVRVVATWNYLQGTSKADGVFIYYKQAFSAPAAFDFALDPAEWKAMDDSGAYSWQADFPVRSGGAGGAPIHYRFGLVAAAGAKLNTAGAVTPAGWEDRVFSGIISANDLNYWDLLNGEFKVHTANGDEIHVDPDNGINIKSRLLQLESIVSKIYSMVLFYRNREEADSPVPGNRRVAIGEGEVGFDGFFGSSWGRAGSIRALAAKMMVQGNMYAKVGESDLALKTRTRIVAEDTSFPDPLCGVSADATHIIAFNKSNASGDIKARVGTISGDALSWGTAASIAAGTELGLEAFFVTASRVVLMKPSSTNGIMYYTYGVFSGSTFTPSGTIKSISGWSNYQFYVSFCGNIAGDGGVILGIENSNPTSISIANMIWNDSTLSFSIGTITVLKTEVAPSGDIRKFGDGYIFSYIKGGETDQRFDVLDSDFNIIGTDVLHEYSGLSFHGGILADTVLLMKIASQFYMMNVENYGVLEAITLPNYPRYSVPGTLSSLGILMEGNHYYTPFELTPYVMGQIGAGIVESGGAGPAAVGVFGTGMIIQTFEYLVALGSSGTLITLPEPFKDASSYNVVGNRKQNNYLGSYPVNCVPYTGAQFRAYVGGTTGTFLCNFIAIGWK